MEDKSVVNTTNDSDIKTIAIQRLAKKVKRLGMKYIYSKSFKRRIISRI